MMRPYLSALGVVLSLLVPLAARAEPLAESPTSTTAETEIQPVGPVAIPKDRVVLNDLTIFRLNPLGLESQVRFGYQHRLYDANHSAALRDNFIFLGTFTRFNPASLRVAGMVEFQPLSLINLRFTAEYLRYFGNFSFMQSRQSATEEWSDSALKANKTGPQGNYSAGGFHASFEPLVQFKVGPVAIRSRAFFGYFDMDLQRGDRVWYEATLDTAVPGKGFIFANDLDILYGTDIGRMRLNIGPRYTVVAPLYNSNQVLPAQSVADADQNGHQRLGLLAALTLYDDGYTSFNKPTLLLISSWYLDHRFRTGADVNRAMPYVVLGFAFQSDLLGGR